MALFDNRLAQEISMLVQQRCEELGGALGEVCKEGLDQWNESSPLQCDWKLLIGVANGECHRTEEAVRHAEQVLMRLLVLLLGNALLSRVVILDDFWKAGPGILVSRVRW